MSSRDFPPPFKPLPASNERRFVWNSDEWWSWFRSHKTKPSVNVLYARLREHDSFVAFHGARPTDTSSFSEFGLRLGNVEKLNDRARQILISKEYPWITPERLESAIAEASTIDDGKLFVVVDPREISGHYLIYGSEHIAGILATVSGEVGFDCQDILKLHGIPTVFRIILPRDLIPDDQLRDFADYIREIYWDERKREKPPTIDWSWILRQEISAQHIHDHVHPESIPDPTKLYIPYRYRDNWPCLI